MSGEGSKSSQKVEIDAVGNSCIADISICQIESNLPCEDRYSVRRTVDIEAFAVYDGHGGYLAADIATSTLLDAIIKNLSSVPLSHRTFSRVAEIIDDAFVQCDALILKEAIRLHKVSLASKPTNANSGILAGRASKDKSKKVMGRAGSCAIVVVVTAGVMFLAHVGDCRAVLLKKREVEKSKQNDPQQQLLRPRSSPRLANRSSGSVSVSVDDSLPIVSKTSASNSAIKSGGSAAAVVGSDKLLRSVSVPASAFGHAHSSSGVSTTASPLAARGQGGGVGGSGSAPGTSIGVGTGDSSFVVFDAFLKKRGVSTRSQSSSTGASPSALTAAGTASAAAATAERPSSSARKRSQSESAVDYEEKYLYFFHQDGDYEVQAITLDHNCEPLQSAEELEEVKKSTTDPQPFRQSEGDKRLFGVARAPLRVAGSLAVTRALGDGYLKVRELSTEVYAKYLPYITARPSIRCRRVLPSDKSLILASDGLWNYLSAESCAEVMIPLLQQQEYEDSSSHGHGHHSHHHSHSHSGHGPNGSSKAGVGGAKVSLLPPLSNSTGNNTGNTGNAPTNGQQLQQQQQAAVGGMHLHWRENNHIFYDESATGLNVPSTSSSSAAAAAAVGVAMPSSGPENTGAKHHYGAAATKTLLHASSSQQSTPTAAAASSSSSSSSSVVSFLRIDSHTAVKEHNCFTGYQPVHDVLTSVCSSFAASAAVEDLVLGSSSSSSSSLSSSSAVIEQHGTLSSPKGSSSNSITASMLCETPMFDKSSPSLSNTKRRKSSLRSSVSGTSPDIVDFIEAEKRKHGVGAAAAVIGAGVSAAAAAAVTATRRGSDSKISIIPANSNSSTSAVGSGGTRRSNRLSIASNSSSSTNTNTAAIASTSASASDSVMEVLSSEEDSSGNNNSSSLAPGNGNKSSSSSSSSSSSALKRMPSLQIDTSLGHHHPPPPAAATVAVPTRPLKIEVDAGPAYKLVSRCLTDAAELCGVRGMTAESLRMLPQGELRREIIDDVTVMVLRFR